MVNSRRTWAIAGAVVAGLVVVGAVVGISVRSSGNSAAGTGPSVTSSTPGDPTDGAATDTSSRTGSDDGSDDPLADIDRSGDAELSDEVIQAGIIQREYLVLRPSWVTDDMRLPLVVALHGLTVDRWSMLDAADWRGEVQRRGFVAVFPQGLANSWNMGECCPPANLIGTDDVGFLDSVIAAVEASQPVDADEVFMTGFSAGGLMTYRYACDRSDALVAIAPVAGSNLSGCAPSVPLPLLHQHSNPDLVVPYDGGFGVGQVLTVATMPSVPDSVAKWAAADGCDPVGTDEALSAGVGLRIWSGCDADVDVKLVTIEGLEHEWPRTKDYDGLATILDFFGIN